MREGGRVGRRRDAKSARHSPRRAGFGQARCPPRRASWMHLALVILLFLRHLLANVSKFFVLKRRKCDLCNLWSFAFHPEKSAIARAKSPDRRADRSPIRASRVVRGWLFRAPVFLRKDSLTMGR